MDPHGSGLLTGGGVRGHFRRQTVIKGKRLKHFPDVHITDSWAIRQTVPDFDPALEHEYTKRELLLLAEKMLLEDGDPQESPAWLSAGRMRARQKREIYVASGVPDPSYIQGMYWRTHPDGRKWNRAKAGTDRSFYR